MEMESSTMVGLEAAGDAKISPSSLDALGQQDGLDCSSFSSTKRKSFYDDLCQHEETRDQSSDDRRSIEQASRQVSSEEPGLHREEIERASRQVSSEEPGLHREEIERAFREAELQKQESAAELLALEARQQALREESARLLEVVSLAEQSGELELASAAKAQLDMSMRKQKSFDDASSAMQFILNQEHPDKRESSTERGRQESHHSNPPVATVDQASTEKEVHNHEQKSQLHAQLLQQVYQGSEYPGQQRAVQPAQESPVQEKFETAPLQQKQPEPAVKHVQQAKPKEASPSPSASVSQQSKSGQATEQRKVAPRKIVLEEPRYDLSRTLVVPAGLTSPLSSPTGKQAIAQMLSQDQPRISAGNSSNWKQQVVNRLRLPGPDMPREQFLTSFLHRGTAMTEHLLNAVFDQLKVQTRDSRGFVTEHVTVPALLQVLEKHNGRDIVKLLDAADLLEANIRNIERKIREPARTIFQQFAARWMCRFLISTAKKAYAELETAAHRFAPQPAVEGYAQTLENYQHVLTKSLAAEKNLSMEQAHVVVSKCLHNMRMELENDLIALRRLEIEAQAAAEEEKAAAASRSRLQQVTPEEAQALGIPYQAILQLQSEGAKAQRHHQPATVAVTYQYPDGTVVTNPAHLPDGAKAAERAAQAHIQHTAELAQQASKRAEEAAIAHVTAAAQAAAALGMPPTSITPGIPGTVPLGEGMSPGLMPPKSTPAPGEIRQVSQPSSPQTPALAGSAEITQGERTPVQHGEKTENAAAGQGTSMTRGLPPLPPQHTMRLQVQQQQQVITRVTSTMAAEVPSVGQRVLSNVSQSSQHCPGQQQQQQLQQPQALSVQRSIPQPSSLLQGDTPGLAGQGVVSAQQLQLQSMMANHPQMAAGLASPPQPLSVPATGGIPGAPSNLSAMMMLAQQQQQQQKEGSALMAPGLFGANRQGLQTTSMPRADKDMFRRTKNPPPPVQSSNTRSRSLVRSPFKQAGKLLAAFGLWKDSDDDEEEENEAARRAASEDQPRPRNMKTLLTAEEQAQQIQYWQRQQQLAEAQYGLNGEQLPQGMTTAQSMMIQQQQRMAMTPVSSSSIQPPGGLSLPLQLNGDSSFLLNGGVGAAPGTGTMPGAYMASPPASARTLPGGSGGMSTVYQGPSATARATALQQAQQYQQSGANGSSDITTRPGGGVPSGNTMVPAPPVGTAGHASFMQSMQQQFAPQSQQQIPQQMYAQQQGLQAPTSQATLSRSQATDRESSEERRVRVSSLKEVPGVQLGKQEVSNLHQVQQQLESISPAQLEAYARQYGLYPTPEAAAAAVGGIPLKGVGALASSSPGVMTQQSAQSYTLMTSTQQSQLPSGQSMSQYYQQLHQSVSVQQQQQQQQALMHHN